MLTVLLVIAALAIVARGLCRFFTESHAIRDLLVATTLVSLSIFAFAMGVTEATLLGVALLLFGIERAVSARKAALKNRKTS